MSEKISKLLNIEDIKESKEITVVEEPVLESEEKQDFDFVRRTLKDTINNATDALEGILDIADNTDDVEAYTTVSSMIKAVSESSRSLYDLHYKRKKTLENPNDKNSGIENYSNDKTVFIGTTAELLTRINEYRNGKE